MSKKTLGFRFPPMFLPAVCFWSGCNEALQSQFLQAPGALGINMDFIYMHGAERHIKMNNVFNQMKMKQLPFSLPQGNRTSGDERNVECECVWLPEGVVSRTSKVDGRC